MPTLPARLAGLSERWFAHPSTVDKREELSPHLLRVGFDAPHVRGATWKRGQEIEFRVSDRDFRHYTPAGIDRELGRVEVVFALASDGPGRRWAEGLDVGAAVGMLGPGPGGGVKGWSDDHSGPSLFLGDATAIGLFQALLPPEDGPVGAVEVLVEDLHAAAALVPALTVLPADRHPGRALRAWLDAFRDPVGRVCLAGHTGSIQDLRADLRARRPGRVATKPHWATGRTGL